MDRTRRGRGRQGLYGWADAGTGENSWLRGVWNVGGYAGDGSVGAFRSVRIEVDKCFARPFLGHCRGVGDITSAAIPCF